MGLKAFSQLEILRSAARVEGCGNHSISRTEATCRSTEKSGKQKLGCEFSGGFLAVTQSCSYHQAAVLGKL